MQSVLRTLVSIGLSGSCKIKQDLGDAAGVELIWRHNALLRETLSEFPEGQVLEKGLDYFLIGFPGSAEAVRFALLLQRRNRELFASAPRSILDSIGIHAGPVLLVPDGESSTNRVFGPPVDLCLILMSLAQPGQILLTRFPFEDARRMLQNARLDGCGELQWINHGTFSDQGVEDTLEICEVGEEGIAPLTAPQVDIGLHCVGLNR